MKVGSQRHAPGHFAPWKDTRSSFTVGWVDRTFGLDGAQNLAPPGFWIAVWRMCAIVRTNRCTFPCHSAFLLLASHDIPISCSSCQIMVSRLRPFVALTAIQQLKLQFPSAFPSLPALEVTSLTTDCLGSRTELRECSSNLVKLGEYG
jgi:hypothetical protein